MRFWWGGGIILEGFVNPMREVCTEQGHQFHSLLQSLIYLIEHFFSASVNSALKLAVNSALKLAALLFYKLAGCFLCTLSGPSQSPCIVTLPLRNVDLTLTDKIPWIPGIPLMWAIVDYILFSTGHHLVSLYGKMVYNLMKSLSMVCLPDYMTCYAS